MTVDNSASNNLPLWNIFKESDMDYQLKCETYVRLCNVLNFIPDNANEWFNSIRLEGNYAIASNKQIMAVERLDYKNPEIPTHVVNNEVLKKQCTDESKFGSDLFIHVNSMLKFASVKTTFGYNHSENAVIWSESDNRLDNWKETVPSETNKAAKGAMFWETHNIANLGKSSPSGCIVFEEFIDERKPVLVRDLNDDRWFGVFVPGVDDGSIKAAELPEWWVK